MRLATLRGMGRSVLRSPRRLVLGAAILAAGSVSMSCGSDGAVISEDASTSTTVESVGTDVPGTTSSGSAAVDEAWALTANGFRDRVGQTVDVECPAGGKVRNVWGSNVYTDDSSICSAAVHVGLITAPEGGTVSIEILPGQDEYQGSEFNGVTSSDYGVWPGSFSFPDAESLDVAADIDWTRNATFYKNRDQSTFTVTCAAGGPPGSVWGTGTYTEDSSICTAGVHAGLITVAAGGTLTFELTPGAELYVGSEANGVTSNGYGPYGGSFTFVTG
jgi:hypothetical protein